MKLAHACITLLVIAMLFQAGCRPKKHGDTALQPQAIITEAVSFKRQQGEDCSLPADERTNCAVINCTYPVIKNGSIQLRKAVSNWAIKYITSILCGYNTNEVSTGESGLLAAGDVFFKTHQNFKGSAMYGGFYAESKYTVLYNSNGLITIAITGNSFQGGAHNNPTAAVATFDTQTGNILKWGDIVVNIEAFKKTVENKLLVERADAFKEGFKFDDIFKFKLPDNYGLVKDGIYCYYTHYEIMPYAFGSTSFVIPYSQVQNLIKLNSAK